MPSPQLEHGISQIVEAFHTFQQEKMDEIQKINSENDALKAENADLKSDLAQRLDKIKEIGSKNSELVKRDIEFSNKIVELDHVLGLLQQENDLITKNFNEMSRKYSSLQHFANELEQFQKNMVEMVKSSTVAYRDFSAANVESLLVMKQDWSESNEPSFRADFSALSIKPEFSRSLPIKSTKDGGKSGDNGNQELDSEFDLWSHHSRKNNISLDRPILDNNNTSPADQELEERRLSNDIGSNYILSNPLLNNSTDTLRRDDDSQIDNGIDTMKTQHLMKPEMVYRLIRQKIGPKDFELFSKAIARFNSGTESCEETMKSISNIVGDKHLIEQMKMHIMNAANA